MWRSVSLIQFIKQIINIDSIGEIIIINNDKEKTPDDQILNHHKINLQNSDRNLYVTPSWNFGASIAKFNHLCFLSDDLIVNENVFDRVDKFLVNEEVGMVCLLTRYLDDPNYEKFYTDNSINIVYCHEPDSNKRPSAVGMGTLFFLRKELWQNIPHIKIFHGEVLQWNRIDKFKKNYIITNCYADTPWHVTWKSISQDELLRSEFSKIQEEDQQFAENMRFTF